MTQVNGKFSEEHHVNFGMDKESLLPSNCASEWRSLRLPYQEMRPHMHSIAEIAKKSLPLNKRLAPHPSTAGGIVPMPCSPQSMYKCTGQTWQKSINGKHASNEEGPFPALRTPLQDDTLPTSPVVSKHEEVTAGHHIGVSSCS